MLPDGRKMRDVLAEQEQTEISPETGRAKHHSTLQLVYIDLIGPIYPKFLGGFQYVHTCLGEYSKLLAVYYLETKQEAVNTLCEYNHDLPVTQGRKIECLRTGHGGESTSEAYRSTCRTLCIKQ